MLAFGTGSVVADADDQHHALALIMAKYTPQFKPHVDHEPPTEHDLSRTAVFRVDIAEWSGKRKAEADDFPGAYTWPVLPQPSAAPD